MPNIGMESAGDEKPRLTIAGPALSATYADLQEEISFFRACGVGKPCIARAASCARANGTSIEAELIAARVIRPEIYYRWLAQSLGLSYLEKIDPASVLSPPKIDALLRRTGPLRVVDADRVITVISPSATNFCRERQRLADKPELRAQFAVASPAEVRRAVWAAGETERVRKTTGALDEDRRVFSARTVLTGAQGFWLALALSGLTALFFVWPIPALIALHVTLTLFFLSASLLRLLAAAFGKRPDPPALSGRQDRLPVYTILIALKDEALVAGQLVRALDRLDWPKSLLDIKLICEREDTATVDALLAADPGPHYEILFVPDHGPKTKPKALAYGLAGARGEFVALYDAEDIPSPGQLLEAYTILSNSNDDTIGCVQAPLVVSNYRSNWLSTLFALEYAGLFRALVPFLGRLGLPIPLGGTSNHFRRDVLERVGGWDPYNVTEDADLGMRLYRAGYRTVGAYHATIEMAPDTLPIWMRQRSRWLKGWLQTWLVLMRQPLRTVREMGVRGFLSAQVFIAGMMVSTLAHPLMYVFITLFLVRQALGVGSPNDDLHTGLFLTDVVSVTSSYVAFATIGLMHMTKREKRSLPRRNLAMLPLYWLAMGLAAWMAIFELPWRAHHWAKTPHRPEETRGRGKV